MLYVELLQVSVEVQYTIKEKLLTHIWHRITQKNFPLSNRSHPTDLYLVRKCRQVWYTETIMPLQSLHVQK